MSVFVPTENQDLIHELGICGCGNPEEAYQAVLDMLKRAEDRKNGKLILDDNNPHELFMAYILDHLGLLEHGSSIYGAWLTAKGKKMLEALEKFAECEFDFDLCFDDEYFWKYEKREANDKLASYIEYIEKNGILPQMSMKEKIEMIMSGPSFIEPDGYKIEDCKGE